jgi:hypothetical protein
LPIYICCLSNLVLSCNLYIFFMKFGHLADLTTDRGCGKRPCHGSSSVRLLWFLTASMADAATGSQSQETPRTATSVASGRRTSTSLSPVSGAGAPSSSGATTPNNAQPTTATAAETAEAGGTSYVVVDDEDDKPVVKKRKLKSDVWLEFDQVKVAERQKAQCHWCKKVIAGDGKSGTNHL